MTISNQAEEHFRQAFDLIRKMPKGKERDDLIDRVLTFCLKISGFKDGQTLRVNYEKEIPK